MKQPPTCSSHEDRFMPERVVPVDDRGSATDIGTGVDRKSLEDHLRHVFPTNRGYAHIAWGERPYLTDTGRYAHSKFRQDVFDLSRMDAVPRLVERLADLASKHDVWICPYVMSGRSRTKGSALSRRRVHADIDHTFDVQKVRDLGGWMIASGTPGHGQCFLEVDRDLTCEEHEVLTRAWAAHLHPEPDAKVSDNDLLRPPGTLNYKAPVKGTGAQPTAVRFEIEPWEATPRSPEDVASLLGIVELAAEVAAFKSRHTKRGAAKVSDAPYAGRAGESQAFELDPDAFPWVCEALAEVSGDRSSDTMRVVGACVRSGLTLEQTRYAVEQRDDLMERLDGRNDDDVATCFEKAVDKRAMERDAWRRQQAARAKTSVPDDLSPLTDGSTSPAVTFREALTRFIEAPASYSGPERWNLPDGSYVRLNVKHLGLWIDRRVPDPSGERGATLLLPERVVPWIAWRPECHQAITQDGKGMPVPVGDSKFTVQVVSARDGAQPGVRVTTKYDYSATDSTSATTVVSTLNAGIALPPGDHVARGRVNNMLITLGRWDGQEERSVYTAMGWISLGDRATYLAPAGSVSHGGIRHDLTVGTRDGSTLGTAMRSAGYVEIAEGDRLVKAASAVAALIGICPWRPDWGVAQFGAIAASVLRMNRGAALVVVAPPDSTKSGAASAAQSFVGGAPMDGKTFGISLPRPSTPAGVAAAAEWHRNACVYCDDYRLLNGNRLANAESDQKFGMLTQGAYGKDGVVKSNADSGISAQGTQECIAVISAETLPAEPALVSRAVVIRLTTGDVVTTPTGAVAAPIDRFRLEYAETGLARALMGAYVQWLARLADENGGLEWLRRHTSDLARQYFQVFASSRAGETVGVLAAGWAMFRRFASENDIEHLIPTEEEVDAILRDIVAANALAHKDATPGPRLLEAIRGLLVAGQMHVMDCDRGPLPAQYRGQCGWRSSGEGEWSTTNRIAGFYAADGCSVLITAETMQYAARHASLSVNKDQIVSAMKGLVVDGSTPGGRAPSAARILDRPAGYLISARSLGLPDIPPDAPGRVQVGTKA